MMEKSRDSLKLENIARVPFSSIFEAYQKFHQHTLESLNIPLNLGHEQSMKKTAQGLSVNSLNSNLTTATS